MVFLEHRPRVYYNIILSYYNNTAIEATALFVQQQVKGAIIADLGAKMAAILDDCERTATVALPTAATSGFISGEVGISAALDAFSTVYELPLMRFKKGQTDRQTRWCSWNTDLAFSTLLYYSNRSHGTVCTTTCKGRNYVRQ